MPSLRLALALCVSVSAAATAQTPGRDAPPGQLYSIGAHKLHLYCRGDTTSKPVVFFEAGGGGYSTTWAKVQDLLPSTVRSCAYDRAGLGWSEAGPGPRTMRQEVLELHELLDAARVQAPLIFVGHSIGALNVRAFAHTYPIEVAGLVLVDPTHESATLYNARAGGWVRVRDLAKRRSVPEPVRLGKPAGAYNADEDFTAEEFERLYLARRQNPQPLGDKPVYVLGAGKRPAPPGTTDSLWALLSPERDAQVKDLATISRNSKFVLDPESGHAIQQDNPQIVAKAILDVLAALAKGEKLTP
jgi:pimeloyl-ACP methyl ester carboxylesterase